MATLAGGCFWCLEAVYEQVVGVEKVVSGYTGGTVAHPSYQDVCTGTTGHAEAVQLTFDPKVVSYRELLEIFFTIHDPTTLNRQGPDEGTQYRSAIFFHSPEQKSTAEGVKQELREAGLWGRPFVTQFVAAPEFYPAEEYHQQYFRRNPSQPYCRAIVAPKVAKFRQKWAKRLKTAP